MSNQSWVELIASGQVDGPTLASSTTPTSIIPAHAKATLQQNQLKIGTKLRFTLLGQISNVVTGPTSFTFDVRFGAVIVATSQALALNVVAKTNVTFELVWVLTCRSVGQVTSATMMHVGKFTSESVIGSPLPSAGGSGVLLIPASAPAVGTGFDSTAAQTVDMFGTWSANNAGDSITVKDYLLESMN